MVAKVATCHEVVDDDHFCVIIAVAKKSGEMKVVELQEHLDLAHELMHTLLGTRFEVLDGDCGGTAVDVALVHMAESPDSNNEGIDKVVGGGLDLDEGESMVEIRRLQIIVFVD